MAAPEPTQDPVVVSPPAGDPQPTPAPVVAPEPVEDWEKRFKGMQQAYQQKDNQFNEAQATIATLTQERDQQRAEKEAQGVQITDLQAAKDTATQSADAQQSEMATLQNKATVQDLILTEFLDLAPVAPMIVATVMNIEGEEAQREALKGWQGTMAGYIGNQVQTQVQNTLRGVTPSTSPARVQTPGMGMTDEQLSARMEQTLGVPGKEDEANILKAEYYRRQEAQGA
jgi:septal ring factor EnvC (AmiA/AmiB activator)